MSTISRVRATLDDLYRVEGKAELIDGRIVELMPSGYLPSKVALRISISLEAFASQVGKGTALCDGIGYAVPELPSGRESFSPDASYYLGPLPDNVMRFIEGPPTFAVEVRSENDYGPAAEREMAEKRADYFVAGTLVVWDVDPKNRTVAVYRSSAPTEPSIRKSGDSADAEPALPGWSMTVNDIFSS